MGQYYYVANVAKRQFLNPQAFGDGLKLREFGCNGEGTMTALALLLACTCSDCYGPDPEGLVGSWAYDRIVIVGDYSDPDAEDEYDPGAIYARCEAALAADAAAAPDDLEVVALRRYAEGWADISEKLVAMLPRFLATISAGETPVVPSTWRARGDDDHGPSRPNGRFGRR